MLIGFASVSAQNSDMSFGVFSGVASYFGDINPTNPIYNPKILYGGLIKYNLSKTYDIKFSYMTTELSGSTEDFSGSWYKSKIMENNDFSTRVNEFALVAEYNFLPLTNSKSAKEWSPYLATGVAMLFSNSMSKSYQPIFPLNVGVKANYKYFSFAFEWSLRKTFTDDLDNLEDPDGTESGFAGIIKNNDWYHYVGISVAIGFKKCATCYNEEKSDYIEMKKRQNRRRRIR